ncbi:putative short-chain dehydrogenases/reductase [Venturia nashicola]|uniref:Putative short-chain dehydrogenases/reductase n=1 Tax=Venturia nashicola TaxID=86259 RepID=A0A4Z1P819_9PEZI|nr:putative short-chain dehydrogenases/reductase [Venturia nashicola]TLD36581.1 putative short-chain dehydrogenases/reductase [Venturia nashicola]
MDGLRKLLSAKWINPPTDPATSFAGKTVIITGANTGIGYEAAIKFVRLGVSSLILGVRNVYKGEVARNSLKTQFPEHKGEIKIWLLDMSSYASVHAFVEKCNRLPAIVNVILNAGVMMKDYEQSGHGWETTLQVNTLSTTLLALLLIPKLKEMGEKSDLKPVLEFVTSDLYRNVIMPGENDPKPEGMDHYSATTPIQSYNSEFKFNGRAQYARSKFFLQCAIGQIARIAGDPSAIKVIVISVSPGVCSSELGRAYAPTGGIKALLFSLVQALLFRTSEQGARSLVSGALTPLHEGELAGIQGGYWRNDEWQELAENVCPEKAEDMILNVWQEIVAALKGENREVLNIIWREAMMSRTYDLAQCS